jgi:hypothetical protein
MTTHEPPPTAGREGSPAAVQLLLLLHRHTEGLPINAIVGYTGLRRETVILALDGLKARHRVCCIGRTQAARWLLAQHAQAATEEAAA